MNRRRFNLSMTAAALGVPLSLRAQTPVTRIVIGLPPGGSADSVARLVADRLQHLLGRTFIVESRPGAAGRLAPETVRQAPPDGHTLLVVPHGPMTLFPFVFKQLRFDPNQDFSPLSRLFLFDYALVAAKGVRVRNADDLRAWGRDSARQASWGSPGAGTVPHFLGYSIFHALGISAVHVPYRGAAPMLFDVVGGVVPLGIATVTDAADLAAAGRLQIVATGGEQRSRMLPQVPTFAEIGIDVRRSGWFGLYAPAGMPPALVTQLSEAAGAAVKAPEIAERVAQLGLSPAPTTSPELARLQREEQAQWRQVAALSKFTPEE